MPRSTLTESIPKPFRPLARRIKNRLAWVRHAGNKDAAKAAHELQFWKSVYQSEGGSLQHAHYERNYTSVFGLDRDYYASKRVLDIGCGPRGSLEWATEAAERVGLDPLVEEYRTLGIDRHAMRYVSASSERMPFSDRHFDIVTAFNSLDHVRELDATIREIARVTREGGDLLIIVEAAHTPTVTEPIHIPWTLAERFSGFQVVSERRIAMSRAGVYESVSAGVPQSAVVDEEGLLLLHLRKRT
jgi:ubiquinone/menaquinone biosynthesis C-methylase UbiE